MHAYRIIVAAIVAASIAALSVTISVVSAAHLKTDPAPQARDLLKLIETIHTRGKPTVDEVVAAYKEYRHLYQLQDDLTADYNTADGSSQESADERYERISKVLQNPGLPDIAETLFVAFDANKPNAPIVLTEKLRNKIQKRINDNY